MQSKKYLCHKVTEKEVHSKFFSKALFLQTTNTLLPIPICYFFVVFLALPMNFFLAEEGWGQREEIYIELANFVNYIKFYGLSTSFLLGCLSALLVFRYLFNNRSANMVHSLPVRREAMFWTHYLAGLSFVIIPNLILLLLTMMALSLQGVPYFTPFFYLFWVTNAFYFFFYSFAVFCAMFTGSPGAVAIYFLIFNFLVAFVTLLMDPLFQVFYVGYTGNIINYPFVQMLTPLFALVLGGGVSITSRTKGPNSYPTLEQISYSMNEINILYWYLLVAVLMIGVSLFVYLKRHIETAGEAVSMKEMKPVFRFAIAIIGGVAVGIVTFVLVLESTYHPMAPYLLPVVSVFWACLFGLVAEMILQKTFRVLKSWKKTLLPMLAVVALFAVLTFDLTGYVSYIPKESEVSSVLMGGFAPYPYDSASPGMWKLGDSQNTGAGIDQDSYAQVTQVHSLLLEPAKQFHFSVYEGVQVPEGAIYTSFLMQYTKTDGYVTDRQYDLYLKPELQDSPGTLEHALYNFYNNKSQVEKNYAFQDILAGEIVELGFRDLYDPEADMIMPELYGNSVRFSHLSTDQLKAMNKELVEALAKDLEEGNIGEKYLNHADPKLVEEGYYSSLNIYWLAGDNSPATGLSTHSNTTEHTGLENQTLASGGAGVEASTLSDYTSRDVSSTLVKISSAAVHTLAVMEQYEMVGDYDFLRNQELLVKYRDWYEKHDLDSLNKVPSYAIPSDEEADFSDPWSFVDGLR